MRELITQFRRLLMRQRICRKAELLEIVAAGRHEVELPDRLAVWAAAGFKDTLLRWSMKPEVVYGYEKEIQSGVQG